MAPLRVLIIGHSFIRRLHQFARLNNSSDCDMNISPDQATIKWHGIGGRTIPKTIRHDLHVVESFRPDIVIVQLGTNDLADHTPLRVGSVIEEFVRLLHDSYGVTIVCVCQTIRRESAKPFNKKVDMLSKYLKVVLEPIPYAIFWGHRGFWKSPHNVYTSDGVHLNNLGQLKLYRSLRGAILKSLRLVSAVIYNVVTS